MRAAGRVVRGLLVDPARPPSLAGFDEPGCAELFELASWHKVPTALGAVADQLPPAIADEVRRQRFAAGKEQFRVLGDLVETGRALDAVGVRWAVFKGPILARLDYGGHLVRRYADVDIVVAPGDVERTVDAILAAGGRELDRNWPMMQRLRLGQLSLVLPHGTACDLHWDLLHAEGERSSFGFRVADVLDARCDTVVGRHHLPTMEPHDHLLFVAVHAVLAGGARLLWLKDIDCLLTQTGIDPAVLLDKAERAGVTLPLAVALDRRRRVLGGDPVPVGGIDAWRTVIAAFDRIRRPGDGPVNLVTGTGLVRCTRSTGRASVAAFAGEVRRFVRNDLVANRTHPWRRPAERAPEPPNPLHTAVGDAATRRAFFESVRTWDGHR